MATYKVTKVRKEPPALNPSHDHIVGVLTADGAYYTNQQVAESIQRGDLWVASAPGEPDAEILTQPVCPNGWCMHQPYLASVPSATLATDLEKMPRG
jgi:hypothetical protein